MAALLKVEKLSKNYGGVQALADVDLDVREGEIHAVIGPNGSGKTTLFNVLTRYAEPTSGVVMYKDKDLAGLRPSAVTAMGLARTFQNVLVFRQMTVLENVMVGRLPVSKASVFHAFYRPAWVKEERLENLKRADEIIEFCGLSQHKDALAKNLPYADQKRLEIARALATEPQLMLLDEPAAGTPTGEVQDLLDLIKRINRLGVTVMLIEHKMDMVMEVSDTISVLNFGRKIAEGTPDAISKDSTVIEAYLGRKWLDAKS